MTEHVGKGDLLHLVTGQLRSSDYAGSSASSMPYVRENCKVEWKVVELIQAFLLSEFSLIKLFNYLTEFLNTIIYIAVKLSWCYQCLQYRLHFDQNFSSSPAGGSWNLLKWPHFHLQTHLFFYKLGWHLFLMCYMDIKIWNIRYKSHAWKLGRFWS